jgi:hypothetical protein
VIDISGRSGLPRTTSPKGASGFPADGAVTTGCACSVAGGGEEVVAGSVGGTVVAAAVVVVARESRSGRIDCDGESSDPHAAATPASATTITSAAVRPCPITL